MVEVISVGMLRLQLLLNNGKQRHAFPARSVLRRLPVDVGLTVLQAGVQSLSPAEENGPPDTPAFFLKFDYSHKSDYFEVMDAEAGIVVHSREVTWHRHGNR